MSSIDLPSYEDILQQLEELRQYHNYPLLSEENLQNFAHLAAEGEDVTCITIEYGPYDVDLHLGGCQERQAHIMFNREKPEGTRYVTRYFEWDEDEGINPQVSSDVQRMLLELRHPAWGFTDVSISPSVAKHVDVKTIFEYVGPGSG